MTNYLCASQVMMVVCSGVQGGTVGTVSVGTVSRQALTHRSQLLLRCSYCYGVGMWD